MATSLKTTLTGLFLLLLSLQGSLAQDVTIASPAQGATVNAGQKLNITLHVQSTTSSVNHIAFSTGFKTTKRNDPTSIGRPYVKSVFPQAGGKDVVLDTSKSTYSYEITIPSAGDFTDGLPGTYNLTVADYYLLGATYTPILKLTSVQVNVGTGSDTSSNNNSGGNGSNGANGTGDARSLQPSLFGLLGAFAIGLFF